MHFQHLRASSDDNTLLAPQDALYCSSCHVWQQLYCICTHNISRNLNFSACVHRCLSTPCETLWGFSRAPFRYERSYAGPLGESVCDSELKMIIWTWAIKVLSEGGCL